MRIRSFATAIIVAGLGAGSTAAMASSIAYTNTGANPSGNTSSLNIGREFVVSGTGITISDLGVYDATAPNLANPHDVTLFSISNLGVPTTTSALATVNIPAGSPPAGSSLDSGFYFKPITPIFLPAGNYAVIAYGLDTGLNGSGDPYADGGGTLASANANDAGFDPYEFTVAASPAFPGGGDGNNHSSASFHFDLGNTTPEPASLSILVFGAFGILARRRRA